MNYYTCVTRSKNRFPAHMLLFYFVIQKTVSCNKAIKNKIQILEYTLVISYFFTFTLIWQSKDAYFVLKISTGNCLQPETFRSFLENESTKYAQKTWDYSQVCWFLVSPSLVFRKYVSRWIFPFMDSSLSIDNIRINGIQKLGCIWHANRTYRRIDDTVLRYFYTWFSNFFILISFYCK